MKIGNAIQLCRVKRRLSLAELAVRASCSTSYLSMVENAKREPSISFVEGVAGALQVPPEILFFLAAERTSASPLDKDLASRLALAALEMLDAPINESTSLSIEFNTKN